MKKKKRRAIQDGGKATERNDEKKQETEDDQLSRLHPLVACSPHSRTRLNFWRAVDFAAVIHFYAFHRTPPPLVVQVGRSVDAHGVRAGAMLLDHRLRIWRWRMAEMRRTVGQQ